jgi:hypothetical protein
VQILHHDTVFAVNRRAAIMSAWIARKISQNDIVLRRLDDDIASPSADYSSTDKTGS